MQTQSEKLEWILNSLFKMVKLEQNVMVFEVSMCPIRKTILDAVNLVYEKAARKQIPIKTGYIPDLFLYHNAKWTSEVFANLLENAVKYTSEGGAIQIDLKQYEMYAEIRITDTGIGIPANEQKKMFKSLFRGNNAINLQITGSGIGMLLTYKLIKSHAGKISMSSIENVGTTFKLAFPIKSRKYNYRIFKKADVIDPLPVIEGNPEELVKEIKNSQPKHMPFPF